MFEPQYILIIFIERPSQIKLIKIYQCLWILKLLFWKQLYERYQIWLFVHVFIVYTKTEQNDTLSFPFILRKWNKLLGFQGLADKTNCAFISDGKWFVRVNTNYTYFWGLCFVSYDEKRIKHFIVTYIFNYPSEFLCGILPQGVKDLLYRILQSKCQKTLKKIVY